MLFPGNGYYALTSHIYPRGWTNVCIVTSDFHMARSRVIFEWVLTLAQEAGSPGKYNLQCVSVSDEVGATPWTLVRPHS